MHIAAYFSCEEIRTKEKLGVHIYAGIITKVRAENISIKFSDGKIETYDFTETNDLVLMNGGYLSWIFRRPPECTRFRDQDIVAIKKEDGYSVGTLISKSINGLNVEVLQLGKKNLPAQRYDSTDVRNLEEVLKRTFEFMKSK